MNFKKITILAYSLLFATFVFAQKIDKTTQLIINEGTDNNLTMEHLDVFSNRFGGRLLGSDAYENALEWAAHELKDWGLEVIIEEAGELPVGFNRGPWFGKMLDSDGMDLHFVTPSYTSGTKGRQRGHVLMEPKTKAEFNQMKGALKGAWVLIGGTSNGWPIDISEQGNKERAAIISTNDSIAKVNSDINQWNR